MLSKSKIISDKKYFWFSKDTILVTQGGFDNFVLFGFYQVYYPNKNLKEAGQFNNGLKIDEWKNWAPDGHLENIFHWSEGVKNGSFELYDSSGKILMLGNYKKGTLNDWVTGFLKNGGKKKTKYKNGRVVSDSIDKN